MESERQESEKIRRKLKEKEDNAAILDEKLKSSLEELVVLENRYDSDRQEQKKTRTHFVSRKNICLVQTSRFN